jgi:hypothetical protein
MKKPLKTAMPKAAAKGGSETKEKGKAKVGGKGTGVNKPATTESVNQVVARATYGQPKPAQKL